MIKQILAFFIGVTVWTSSGQALDLGCTPDSLQQAAAKFAEGQNSVGRFLEVTTERSVVVSANQIRKTIDLSIKLAEENLSCAELRQQSEVLLSNLQNLKVSLGSNATSAENTAFNQLTVEIRPLVFSLSTLEGKVPRYGVCAAIHEGNASRRLLYYSESMTSTSSARLTEIAKGLSLNHFKCEWSIEIGRCARDESKSLPSEFWIYELDEQSCEMHRSTNNESDVEWVETITGSHKPVQMTFSPAELAFAGDTEQSAQDTCRTESGTTVVSLFESIACQSNYHGEWLSICTHPVREGNQYVSYGRFGCVAGSNR